jgi:hypothetical protein
MSSSATKKAPGRPKRPVHSQLHQIQPLEASLRQTPQHPSFAATIKLTPAILKALEQQLASGAGKNGTCSIQLGAKENDVSLVIDGVHHKLRCAKESTTTEVYESAIYDDPAAARAVDPDPMDIDGEDPSALSRPLFDPYTSILYPRSHVRLAYKYSLVKELTDEVKREVKERSERAAQEEIRASKTIKVQEASGMTPAAAAAAIGARPTPIAKKPTKRKDAPAGAVGEESAASKPKKLKATSSSSDPHLLSPASAALSPNAVMSPAAAANSPSAASPAAPTSKAPPRLLRSPSTAALPSSLTAHEQLRSRLIHFLAAQVHGLPMATLINRLGVRPENMKGTLTSVATYESPGAYYLRRELYPSLSLSTWPDYTDEDRRRVVAKMERMGLEVREEWRQWKPTLGEARIKANGAAATAGGTSQPGAAAASSSTDASPPSASAASPSDLPAVSTPHTPSNPSAISLAASLVAPILSSPSPPLPDLHSLPSVLPPGSVKEEKDEAGEVVQREREPMVLKDYLHYLACHTKFLHQKRAYDQIGAWKKDLAEKTIALKGKIEEQQQDLAVRSALKKQLVAFVKEHETIRDRVDRAQKILHVILRSMKLSLQQFASQHKMFQPGIIRQEKDTGGDTTTTTDTGGVFVSPEPMTQ